jgi:hypothetical protein
MTRIFADSYFFFQSAHTSCYTRPSPLRPQKTLKAWP